VKSHFDEPSMSTSGQGAPAVVLAETEQDFRRDLLELIPFLRAFSRSLCGDRELADDLAQEALAKAWQSRDTFRAGSNLKAWLFTILRNQFYSDRRRAWRQAPWDESAAERVPIARGEQTWAVQLSDTARALRGLPAEQRSSDPGRRGWFFLRRCGQNQQLRRRNRQEPRGAGPQSLVCRARRQWSAPE
jgi:RNA polymerase sigma-70 factor, ECF subfamily